MAINIWQRPFFVRQAGLSKYNETEKGAIVGFDDKATADADATERNSRASSMGLKARYEVLEGVPA